MSGTSLDGVDAAVIQCSGSGRSLEVDVLAFVHRPYPPALRSLLVQQCQPATSSVYDLSQLNVRLAHLYAEAVRQAVDAAGLEVTDLALVGSHGQTVHHVPTPSLCAGLDVRSTLQIGDPSVLANLLACPVVGDFRLADMALGGQGAPLVPYVDYALFSDDEEARGLLNLGGIANLTVLPRQAEPADVLAFDTGPANLVIDALAQRFFDQPYDTDGQLAARGTIHNDVLADLLTDPFFRRPPPKSTGREQFGVDYVARLVDDYGQDLSAHDLLATATVLTAASVFQAYVRFVRDETPLDALIVSGGGVHNRFLMDKLADAFAPIPVRPAGAYDVDADAKEAVCFAVLAYETMCGVPTNLPSVTGASRPTLLGKICLPA